MKVRQIWLLFTFAEGNFLTIIYIGIAWSCLLSVRVWQRVLRQEKKEKTCVKRMGDLAVAQAQWRGIKIE